MIRRYSSKSRASTRASFPLDPLLQLECHVQFAAHQANADVQLLQKVGTKLELSEGQRLAGFLSPHVWLTNKEHAISEFRKDKALKEEDFKYHVVDIDNVRLYLIEFPAPKLLEAIFMWQRTYFPKSIYLFEDLLGTRKYE